MAMESNVLDGLAGQILAEVAAINPNIKKARDEGPVPREVFLELLVLALANLYQKVPLAAALYDRAMLKFLTTGMDDSDAGKLVGRVEDWIRQEGMVRILEGQKSYTLNRSALAVLSTLTAQGSVGELMQAVASCYLGNTPTPHLRALSRQLGSYFLARLGRS